MAIQQIINAALRKAGYSAQVSRNDLNIELDLSPILLSRADETAYLAEVTEIHGVTYDEGQGNGYNFDIDPAKFDRRSEQQLLRVIEKYRKKEISL